MEELKMELNKREQEILAVGAKMKTLEEQHQDYQRHIAVLKESLCAKEEHYNMLQADVCPKIYNNLYIVFICLTIAVTIGLHSKTDVNRVLSFCLTLKQTLLSFID